MAALLPIVHVQLTAVTIHAASSKQHSPCYCQDPCRVPIGKLKDTVQAVVFFGILRIFSLLSLCTFGSIFILQWCTIVQRLSKF